MLFSPEEKGQGLVEYAIIIVFVAILVIVILRLLGTNLGSAYSSISSSMP
jgi:pilus assembly protein Flp/PilA